MKFCKEQPVIDSYLANLGSIPAEICISYWWCWKGISQTQSITPEKVPTGRYMYVWAQQQIDAWHAVVYDAYFLFYVINRNLATHEVVSHARGGGKCFVHKAVYYFWLLLI